MRPEAVGPELHEAGPGSGTHVLDGAGARVEARQDVHPVRRPRRHPVGGRLDGEVGLRLRPSEGRTHRVEVVLAREHHRQAPERREVHRLVERALRDGAVPEEAHRDPVAPLHRVGECEADGQG